MTKLTLNKSEKDYLRQLGLSPHAVTLYEQLLEHDSLTARQAAGISKGFPTAEYRLFRQLERLGLVRRSDERPVRFTPINKGTGLQAAYIQKRADLDRAIQELGMKGDGEPGLELIIGRQALYERYVELADQAKREVCIYAIGIAYSDELLKAQRNALKRGVRIRHVLQQVKPSNFHVAHKWRRLGVRLRYLPSERGFHLMLFDGQTALVSFSNPNNTDDRLSILTGTPAAVRLFEIYFQDVWNQAQEVEV